MTIEDRLRRAIAERTADVEPQADGLTRIEEKLMENRRLDRRNRLWAGLAAAIVLVALVAGGLALLGGDDDEVVTEPPPSSSTTEPPAGSTSTEAPTSTTTEAPSFTTVDPAVAIWPRAHTSQRFGDPVAAAYSFAVELVGFTDPVVGEYRAGDNRSGEVPIRPGSDETSPETTVLVRQLEDDTWFVIGAETEDITLDQPVTGELVDCPLTLTGTALAFEGHVDVAIWDDHGTEPIGTGFVTGSGVPPAGSFEGTVDCDESVLGAAPQYGSIVLTTSSAEDGQIWQAVARRVRLK